MRTRSTQTLWGVSGNGCRCVGRGTKQSWLRVYLGGRRLAIWLRDDSSGESESCSAKADLGVSVHTFGVNRRRGRHHIRIQRGTCLSWGGVVVDVCPMSKKPGGACLTSSFGPSLVNKPAWVRRTIAHTLTLGVFVQASMGLSV